MKFEAMNWKSLIDSHGCAHIPEGATEIPNSAFEQYILKCSSEPERDLVSVIIPKSISIIGSNAFEGCTRLRSIEIPNTVVEIREGTFRGCSCSDVISFGDRDIDIQASRAAGTLSVACLWGTKDVDKLLSANPIFYRDPSDVLSLCKAL